MEPIKLTDTEAHQVAKLVGWSNADHDAMLVHRLVQAVNEVCGTNATFRAVARDLERLERSGLTFNDRARDLFLSYHITLKTAES